MNYKLSPILCSVRRITGKQMANCDGFYCLATSMHNYHLAARSFPLNNLGSYSLHLCCAIHAVVFLLQGDSLLRYEGVYSSPSPALPCWKVRGCCIGQLAFIFITAGFAKRIQLTWSTGSAAIHYREISFVNFFSNE